MPPFLSSCLPLAVAVALLVTRAQDADCIPLACLVCGTVPPSTWNETLVSVLCGPKWVPVVGSGARSLVPAPGAQIASVEQGAQLPPTHLGTRGATLHNRTFHLLGDRADVVQSTHGGYADPTVRALLATASTLVGADPATSVVTVTPWDVHVRNALASLSASCAPNGTVGCTAVWVGATVVITSGWRRDGALPRVDLVVTEAWTFGQVPEFSGDKTPRAFTLSVQQSPTGGPLLRATTEVVQGLGLPAFPSWLVRVCTGGTPGVACGAPGNPTCGRTGDATTVCTCGSTGVAPAHPVQSLTSATQVGLAPLSSESTIMLRGQPLAVLVLVEVPSSSREQVGPMAAESAAGSLFDAVQTALRAYGVRTSVHVNWVYAGVTSLSTNVTSVLENAVASTLEVMSATTPMTAPVATARVALDPIACVWSDTSETLQVATITALKWGLPTAGLSGTSYAASSPPSPVPVLGRVTKLELPSAIVTNLLPVTAVARVPWHLTLNGTSPQEQAERQGPVVSAVVFGSTPPTSLTSTLVTSMTLVVRGNDDGNVDLDPGLVAASLNISNTRYSAFLNTSGRRAPRTAQTKVVVLGSDVTSVNVWMATFLVDVTRGLEDGQVYTTLVWTLPILCRFTVEASATRGPLTLGVAVVEVWGFPEVEPPSTSPTSSLQALAFFATLTAVGMPSTSHPATGVMPQADAFSRTLPSLATVTKGTASVCLQGAGVQCGALVATPPGAAQPPVGYPVRDDLQVGWMASLCTAPTLLASRSPWLPVCTLARDPLSASPTPSPSASPSRSKALGDVPTGPWTTATGLALECARLGPTTVWNASTGLCVDVASLATRSVASYHCDSMGPGNATSGACTPVCATGWDPTTGCDTCLPGFSGANCDPCAPAASLGCSLSGTLDTVSIPEGVCSCRCAPGRAGHFCTVCLPEDPSLPLVYDPEVDACVDQGTVCANNGTLIFPGPEEDAYNSGDGTYDPWVCVCAYPWQGSRCEAPVEADCAAGAEPIEPLSTATPGCVCSDSAASPDEGCVREAGYAPGASSSSPCEDGYAVDGTCQTCPAACTVTGGVCAHNSSALAPWNCLCPNETTFVADVGCVSCEHNPRGPCSHCEPCSPEGGFCGPGGSCICKQGWDPTTSCASCTRGWVLGPTGCVPCTGAGARCGPMGTCVSLGNVTTCHCVPTAVNLCTETEDWDGDCCVSCPDPHGAWGLGTECSACSPSCPSPQVCLPGTRPVCVCPPGTVQIIGVSGDVDCAWVGEPDQIDSATVSPIPVHVAYSTAATMVPALDILLLVLLVGISAATSVVVFYVRVSTQ